MKIEYYCTDIYFQHLVLIHGTNPAFHLHLSVGDELDAEVGIEHVATADLAVTIKVDFLGGGALHRYIPYGTERNGTEQMSYQRK